MKINILYPDKETAGSFIYPDPQEIINDLNLNLIFELAGRSTEETAVPVRDEYICDAMRRLLMIPVCDENALKYRQSVVKAAIEHPEFTEKLYDFSKRAEKEISEHLKSADKLKGGGAAVVEKL